MSRVPYRLPLALSAFLTLIFAVWGGLLRLQWHLPIPQANWISFHGPLMVSGFFGTVIGLARARVLASKLGLLVPLATALGAWVLMTGEPENWGALLFWAGSLGYLLVSLGYFGRQPAPIATLALAGGCGWAWSNFFWWRGVPIPHLMGGWQSLFVLTIASERLEAVHWQGKGWDRWVLSLAVLTILAGVAYQPFQPGPGVRLLSTGYLLFALCLLFLDHGWSGGDAKAWGSFTKACLVSAYSWLLIGAGVGSILAPVDSGFAYDAFLHCVFLGLVFSMVFSHAPLLLPRVLRTPVPFHPVFYAHWILLQASLVVRASGDLMGSTPWRRWGALLNALALALFVINTWVAVIRGRRSKT